MSKEYQYFSNLKKETIMQPKKIESKLLLDTGINVLVFCHVAMVVFNFSSQIRI